MNGLGIVVALAPEARCLVPAGRRVRPGVPIAIAAGTLLVCGAGPRRARAAAETLLADGAAALLSWGTAGGLEPGLRPGTLCLPEALVARDGARLVADPAWRGRLEVALPRGLVVQGGLLAGAAAVLTAPAEKAALHARTGAVAVDAESEAVAQTARGAGAAFLAVRVVVDPAEAGLPRAAVAAVDEAGRVRPGRLLAALLRRPGELPSLVAVAGGFRAAHRALAATARAAGPASFGWRGEDGG